MFGCILESLHLRASFRQALSEYVSTHPTAEMQGKIVCIRCGTCCWTRPGALNKNDVKIIAAHLGGTPDELFSEYLVTDKIVGRRCVLPRRAHQADFAGRYIPWRETYSFESPCVFYDSEKGCTIEEVKPEQCRISECWNKDGVDTMVEWSAEDLKKLGWDGIDGGLEDEDDD